MAKKLFIKTYGCQMNAYDTDRMADVLAPLGYETVPEPDGADMVILNTCHIREKAAEKVFSDLGRIRQLKDAKAADGENMIVAVAGCVAQAEGKEILHRAPTVDMVFGPQSYHRLPDMLDRLAKGAKNILDTDFPVEDKFDALPKLARKSSPTAFLTVQEGCDKFCTFCVVPYTRGAEYSRGPESILAEAQKLVAEGTREITLLGQNVNAFHGSDESGIAWNLARLIRTLDGIEGLDRIRYVTSHPRDVDDDLIAAHRSAKKLMPYLHLPVQSGSDRVLKAMNRQHTGEDYRKLVARFRKARPDIALSSDFIVGFPGESDQDFEDTMDLIRDVTYAQAYSFKYSPRPGTPGADMKDQVPEPIKSARLTQLQALINEQAAHFHGSMVGQEMDILFEKSGRNEGQLVGRSPYLQPVFVDAPAELVGQMGRVLINETSTNSLGGKLLNVAGVL